MSEKKGRTSHPAATKPAATKPAATKPAATRPAATKPAEPSAAVTPLPDVVPPASEEAAGQDGASAPVEGRPYVVAVAVERARRRGAIRKLNHVAEHGGRAVMITAEGRERHELLRPDVVQLDLQVQERATGINALITRDPMRLVRRAMGQQVSGPSWAWRHVSVCKPYRMIRPWMLWRALRRRLAELDVDQLDHVIIVHPNSWPIAWHLHRLNPRISISYEVPDTVWVTAGRPVPPPLPVEIIEDPATEDPAKQEKAEDAASGPEATSSGGQGAPGRAGSQG